MRSQTRKGRWLAREVGDALIRPRHGGVRQEREEQRECEPVGGNRGGDLQQLAAVREHHQGHQEGQPDECCPQEQETARGGRLVGSLVHDVTERSEGRGASIAGTPARQAAVRRAHAVRRFLPNSDRLAREGQPMLEALIEPGRALALAGPFRAARGERLGRRAARWRDSARHDGVPRPRPRRAAVGGVRGARAALRPSREALRAQQRAQRALSGGLRLLLAVGGVRRRDPPLPAQAGRPSWWRARGRRRRAARGAIAW